MRQIDFLKFLSNNSWIRSRGRWKERRFATYVARIRPRDFASREMRARFSDFVAREIRSTL